jgi:hypothetical protein
MLPSRPGLVPTDAARWLRARWLNHPFRPVRIRRLDGPEAGTSIILVGGGRGLDYLLTRGLEQDSVPTAAGWTRIGGMASTLERALDRAELVLARLPVASAAAVRAGFLRLPELVDAVIDLPPCGERWPGTRSARSSERRVRASGLSWSLATDRASFQRFCRDLYRPYAAARFGPGAVIRSTAMLRARFRSGGIQEIRQGDRLLAAQLVSVSGAELECVAVGATPDPAVLGQGALAATTLFAAELARQRGLRHVNLGGSLPSLTDPVLVNKRLWGARLVLRPRADHDLLLGWREPAPVLARLLARLEPVLRTRSGLGSIASTVPGLDEPIPMVEVMAGSSRELIARFGLA